jgi:hypothetical protein
MDMKIIVAATIVTGILGCGHAVAQESLKGAVMVFAKGTCTHFVVSGQSYQCTSVVYTHFRNGRTAWQVPMPNSALMLAGGRDSQLDPMKYVLQIDRLRAGRFRWKQRALSRSRKVRSYAVARWKLPSFPLLLGY